MTEFTDLYSSCPRTHKSVPLTSLKCGSNISSPIPIPRRQSVHLPPCSPTRGQGSPELVFNFDFSISPDGSDATSHLLRQQYVASARRPPRQKAAYVPLSILGTNHPNAAYPYAHEPFLYPIPKLPVCDEKSTYTHKSGYEVNCAAAKEQVAPAPPPASIPSISSLSSLSSFHSSNPSYPPSTDASWQLGTDDDFPLTSAFHESTVLSTTTSPTVSFQDAERSSLSPPTPRRTPSPSPRPLPYDVHTHRSVLNRRVTFHRTTTAAPIVSLSVAQAERSHQSMGIRRGGRSRSPGSSRVLTRTRRSSSASAGLGLEKFREPSRHMGTVIGRGASRVISMFEYGYAGARSLVSDEDIERSLEKDQVSKPPGADRGRKRDEEREKEGSMQDCSNTILERGRARARASVHSPPGDTRTCTLPGWS
ncbi:hypothetical protein V8D89_005568 [Ganoderma adspersum]